MEPDYYCVAWDIQDLDILKYHPSLYIFSSLRCLVCFGVSRKTIGGHHRAGFCVWCEIDKYFGGN